jgi:hypothetical protein
MAMWLLGGTLGWSIVEVDKLISFANACSVNKPSLMLGLMGNDTEPVTGALEVLNITL